MGLDPKVPGCPDWTVGQLVVHLGDVYDFWGRIVEGRIPDEAHVQQMVEGLQQEREAREDPEFYGTSAAIEYFDGRAANIVRILEAASPEQSNWTWWPPNQTAGFAQRRMAHETSVHRWDAQSAHGVEEPITPAEMASDGVDEVFTNGLTGWPDEGMQYPNHAYHFHCTDAAGELTISFTDGAPSISRTHQKSDVAVTGPASDVLLYVWRRIPIERITVHGDAKLLNKLTALLERD